MPKLRLLHPNDVRERLSKRYATQRPQWLAGQGVWPLEISLGTPRESDAQQHRDVVAAWVSEWHQWHGPGTLEWQDRQWRMLGLQRLPFKLSLTHAGDVVGWLGERERWKRSQSRFRRLVSTWPRFTKVPPSDFDVLADYSEVDFECVVKFITWLAGHPRSNLYSRQLPISGIDSKWIEGHTRVLRSLVGALRNDGTVTANFYEDCGLRTPPSLVRVRILDANLRTYLHGLSDVTAPPADIALLDWPVQSAFIVENIQTGLCFHDLPGSVVFMGLGYSVDALGQIPWLKQIPCIYWGDIDTHGFAILNRARSHLPQLASCLMDESILLENRSLWSEEPSQHSADEFSQLTTAEGDVYQGLKEQRWGVRIRLEQERIDWHSAWERLFMKHQKAIRTRS